MLRLLVSLVLSLACAQALADPPLRVARLAYLRGPVSFSPAGTDDWALASLNRPLIAGDRLWTDPAGRDELQLGGAAVRMDGGTLLSILTLDDRALQVQLSQGTLNVRVRPGPAAGTIEVDTPNLALTIDQPGHYRIGVDPAGDTTVVRVDDGQAQALGRYQAYSINPGQYVRFAGPDLRTAQALDTRKRDDFDRWAAARDQRADRAVAARYVSPAMIGYDDLDEYGSWRTVPAYGHVWVPRGVSRGWAPYRDGHWAYIEPWGWTWIDDAPWGFAVTHYGRWANLDGEWAWVPERANAMPVYAPALVAFAAMGNSLARGQREPAVAWFPLGPREAYRPPYPASQRYLSAINYNITKGTNNAYVNRQVRGAVTAVPTSAFTHARPVRSAAVALPQERVTQARVIAAPEVQARRESVASDLSGGHRPAQALLARPAMTHMRPAISHAPQQTAAAPAPQAPAAQAQAPSGAPHGGHEGQRPPRAGPAPSQAAPAVPQPQSEARAQAQHPHGGPHGEPQRALSHPQTAPHPAPMPAAHEPPRVQEHAQQAPHPEHTRPQPQPLPQREQPAPQHIETTHPQPQREQRPPNAETPHPQREQRPPHAETPHPQPQQAQRPAQPAPPHLEASRPPPAARPEPQRQAHEPPPQAHQPAHPAGQPAHASDEPAKEHPEHGQHGHKDEHH